MANRHIVDRALPDRAKLLFYFPMPSVGDNYFIVELPFFENVSIKESKKARYQKYSLISRSSNLYSYLGADSRQLTLSFNMTLPHILEEHSNISIDNSMSLSMDKENTELEKSRFLVPLQNQPPNKSAAFALGTQYTKSLSFVKDSVKQILTSDWAVSGMTLEEVEYFKSIYGVTLDDTVLSPQVRNRTVQRDNPGEARELIEDSSLRLKNRIIDIIIYWTNLIRASVVNYSQNPIYGPPIIRLRHGIMYQDIPCICTNYSIDYNEAAGYDLLTLLPRQLKITMKLEELRTGDFGVFDPNNENHPVKKDNLAGWEAVVLQGSHSMDPGYGDLY